MKSSDSENSQAQIESRKGHGRNARLGIVGGCFLVSVGGPILVVFFPLALWLSWNEASQYVMPALLGAFIVVVIGLFLWGSCHLAQSKGYHPAWGLVAVLTVIGLPILVCLPCRKGSDAYSSTPFQEKHERYLMNASLGVLIACVAPIMAWLGVLGPEITSLWPERLNFVLHSDAGPSLGLIMVVS